MGEKNEVTDSFPASTQPQMDIHHKKMLCVQLLSRVRQAVGADVLADSENRARCARSAGAYGAAADLAKVAESLGVLAVGELPQLCLARQSQQLASLATRVATSLATPTATSATSTSAVAAGVSPHMYAQGAHTAVETFSSNCSVRHDDHRSEHNEGPLPDPMISGVSCPIGITLARDALEEMIRLPLMVAPHLLRGIRTPPCSLMLHGPPGTGKTSLVKYMAAAFELPLFSIRPGDVLSKWSVLILVHGRDVQRGRHAALVRRHEERVRVRQRVLERVELQREPVAQWRAVVSRRPALAHMVHAASPQLSAVPSNRQQQQTDGGRSSVS